MGYRRKDFAIFVGIIRGKMAGSTPKHEIRNSVFTNLFQDKKYLLKLYKTLHPEDSDVTEDEIEDVTIKHILVDGVDMELGQEQDL